MSFVYLDLTENNSCCRRLKLMFIFLLSSLILHLSAQPRITLVGTGGPELTPERQGESTLIEANGQSLLFDAGRGTLDGLYRSGIAPQQVTKVFLTHLHSDHIEGLSGLWITPWFLLARKTPLEVWGPIGTKQMIEGMRTMYAHDLEKRSNPTFKLEYLNIIVHEIAEGPVYNLDSISVSAIRVEHADGEPAFAYRIQTAQATILLTGDCTYSTSLAAVVGPLDLLICNVAAGTPALETTERLRPVFSKLMQPEQAALLFNQTKPRLAVYSHIVKKGLPGNKGDRIVINRTRKAGYTGPLLMGTDHLQIVLDKKITINYPTNMLPDFDGPDAHF